MSDALVVRDLKQILLLSSFMVGCGAVLVFLAGPELPSASAVVMTILGVLCFAFAARLLPTKIVVDDRNVTVRGIWKTVRYPREEIRAIGFRRGSRFNTTSVCVCVVTSDGSRVGPATLATTRGSEKGKYWQYQLSTALNVPIEPDDQE